MHFFVYKVDKKVYIIINLSTVQTHKIYKEIIMNKQQIVAEAVKAGTFTRQEILEKAECTSAALASYFSAMRNASQFTDAAVCPVEKEVDGKKVFVAMSFEDAEQYREEHTATKSRAAAKSPEERYEAASKRVAKCENAAEKARGRAENSPGDRELELRAQKAEIELELAEIDFGRCEVPEGVGEMHEAVEENDADAELM